MPERHLATAVCSWRGHVFPAESAERLDGPLLLGVDVDLSDPGSSDGPVPGRLVRCLRCDAWRQVDVPPAGSAHPLPAPAELDLPRRGDALRSALVMRIIAVERAIHSIFFLLVAILAIILRAEITGVKSWVRHLLDQLTNQGGGTGQDFGGFGGSFLVKEGHHLLELKNSTLNIVIAAAVGYFLIEGIEAVGLWKEKRWAEYLTVIATVGFIPYEVDELVKGISALKVIALVLNVAVLIYLLWSKELFGIGRLRHRNREAPPDPLEPFARPAAGAP